MGFKCTKIVSNLNNYIIGEYNVKTIELNGVTIKPYDVDNKIDTDIILNIEYIMYVDKTKQVVMLPGGILVKIYNDLEFSKVLKVVDSGYMM